MGLKVEGKKGFFRKNKKRVCTLLATKEGEFSWDLLLLYAPDCYYFHIAVSVCAVAFNIQQSSLTPRPSLQFGTKKSQFSSLFMASNPRFDKCSPCAIFHSPSPPYCFPLYLVRSHYHKSNSNLSSSVVKNITWWWWWYFFNI